MFLAPEVYSFSMNDETHTPSESEQEWLADEALLTSEVWKDVSEQFTPEERRGCIFRFNFDSSYVIYRGVDKFLVAPFDENIVAALRRRRYEQNVKMRIVDLP